jgi:hypothetical protein
MQSFFNNLLYYFDILPCIKYTFKQPIVLDFVLAVTPVIEIKLPVNCLLTD